MARPPEPIGKITHADSPPAFQIWLMLSLPFPRTRSREGFLLEECLAFVV